MRLITIALLFASSMLAETVYLSGTGKTFHKAATCSILKRSPKIYQAERDLAAKHGLKECRSCYSKRKAGVPDWATEVGKK
jgi:hypothetical protein